MTRTVTKAILDGYVGQGIGDICGNHFDSPEQNHCAHFVSHALEIQLGTLCGDMAYATRHTGATIRCDELYNRLPRRGDWANAPAATDGCLLFVTLTSNMVGTQMGNAPRKHVGIVFGGCVYNFGNSGHAVRREPTVDAFKSRMGHAYGGMDQVSFFYAVPQ
jgi:hypothetical protein